MEINKAFEWIAILLALGFFIASYYVLETKAPSITELSEARNMLYWYRVSLKLRFVGGILLLAFGSYRLYFSLRGKNMLSGASNASDRKHTDQ